MGSLGRLSAHRGVTLGAYTAMSWWAVFARVRADGGISRSLRLMVIAMSRVAGRLALRNRPLQEKSPAAPVGSIGPWPSR